MTADVTTPPETDAILDAIMGAISPVAAGAQYKNVCIYGDFGSGKTVFSATAPGPILHVNVEKGASAISNHPELDENVEIFKWKSFRQMEVLAEYISQGKVLSKRTGEPIQTVVFDTVDALQNKDLDIIIAEAVRKDQSRIPYVGTWPEFNASTGHMRQLLSTYRDLDVHFIMLVHEINKKDGKTGTMFWRPDVTEVLSQEMGRMCDVIGRMQAFSEGGVFRNQLRVRPTDQIQAKTRIGGLPEIINNPTFDMLLNPSNYFSQKAV